MQASLVPAPCSTITLFHEASVSDFRPELDFFFERMAGKQHERTAYSFYSMAQKVGLAVRFPFLGNSLVPGAEGGVGIGDWELGKSFASFSAGAWRTRRSKVAILFASVNAA